MTNWINHLLLDNGLEDVESSKWHTQSQLRQDIIKKMENFVYLNLSIQNIKVPQEECSWANILIFVLFINSSATLHTQSPSKIKPMVTPQKDLGSPIGLI